MNLIDIYPLLASITSIGIGQTYKIIKELLKTNRLTISVLTASGGMPSSHSALMASLSTSLAFREGLFSSEFYISLLLSSIIVYDAMGVRRSVGTHAAILNKLEPKKYKLKENIGHTPSEVFVGIIVGVVSSIILYFLIQG